MEHLSLWELCEGNLEEEEGGSRLCRRRLWRWASLSIGAPLRKGSHVPGTLKDEGELWKWSISLSLWEVCERNLGGGVLYWGP